MAGEVRFWLGGLHTSLGLTSRDGGFEATMVLPDGAIGVAFAYKTREGAIADGGGEEPACFETNATVTPPEDE